MSNWATRATAHFLKTAPEPTPIAPETHLLGVLGVPPPRLHEGEPVSIQSLMAAAMRACDFYKDSDAAREDMRQQVVEIPNELRSDLLSHFAKAYGANHG